MAQMELFYKELDTIGVDGIFLYQIYYGHHIIVNINAYATPKVDIMIGVYFDGESVYYRYDGNFYWKTTTKLLSLERSVVKNKMIGMFCWFFFKNSNILEKVVNHNDVNNHEIWDVILDRVEKNQKILSIMGM